MINTRRHEAGRGALLGTFVGDALGMPYEGLHLEAIPDRLEMAEARLGRGTYTDDTEMMIGLAESLLERGDVDPDHLAASFVENCDPARGYGAGTLEVFDLWRSGVGVDEAAARVFGGRGSFGNGAARGSSTPRAMRHRARRCGGRWRPSRSWPRSDRRPAMPPVL